MHPLFPRMRCAALMLFLAFLGGVLTIASPCILPVVPLVLARADRSVWRDTLPLLLGLALAYTGAALIATTTARWVLAADSIARWASLALLAGVGLALLSVRVSDWLARPLTRAATQLLARKDATNRLRSVAANVTIGTAIGLLWAPCAGPILGLLIAAAAKSSVGTAARLFFSFSIGAVLMLGLVISLGSRVMAFARRAGAAEQLLRRALGAGTLTTVVALAFGWDQALFARAGIVNTAFAEQQLIRTVAPEVRIVAGAEMSVSDFARLNTPGAPAVLPELEGTLPGFPGATEWINSQPLTPAALHGKVVLVDFWTFACYNCLNALPHVKALAAKYRDKGLVVIGVHTPELARERVLDNVRREVKRLGIEYPVVVDNDYTIWNAFHNQYWPAAYYADASGKLRFYHFGEGKYEEQDQVVAKLLAEAGNAPGAARPANAQKIGAP